MDEQLKKKGRMNSHSPQVRFLSSSSYLMEAELDREWETRHRQKHSGQMAFSSETNEGAL